MIWFRSIGAVLAGFVSMAVVVGLSAPIALSLTRRFGSQPNAPYLAANISFSFLAAVLGGFVCGQIADRSPMIHSIVLAAIVLLLGATTALRPSGAQPVWYPWTIAAVGSVGVLVGGFVSTHALTS